MPASHTYAGLELETHGDVLHGLSRTFENAQDGLPTSITYTFTVSITLSGRQFADLEASLSAIRSHLDAHPEGMLVIRDEDDAILHSRRVRITTDTTPEAWRQYVGSLQLTFVTRDHSISDLAADATYTPIGQSAVTLPNVRRAQVNVASERVDPALANRRNTREIWNLAGSLAADQTLSATDRRAWLMAQRELLRAAAGSKTGTLSYAGQSYVTECDSLDADLPGDGSERLEWTATFSHQIFPEGEDYAEAEYEALTSTDRTSGQVTLTVSGNVRAATRTAALAKAESIRAHFASTGTLDRSDVRDRYHSGTDSASLPGDPIDLSFTYAFRLANASVESYTLEIGTRTDKRAGIKTIRYSGRVVAATASAALDKARSLGDNKHTHPVSSDEAFSYEGLNGETAQRFIACTFSYDYEQRDTTVVFAQVSASTSRDFFGNWRMSVTGTCTAASEASARSTAATFKLTGSAYLPLSEEDSSETVHQGGVAQWRQVTFAYQYQIANGRVAIDYGRTTSRDWSNLTQTVTFDGMCRGASESVCQAAVAGLITGTGGLALVADSFTPSFRRIDGVQMLEGYRFTYTYIGALAPGGAPGSIIEAEVTIERTYSVNKAVITPIPYSTPHVQPNVGTTPGYCRVSGTARGISSSALESWATSKRSLAPGGGYEQPGTLATTAVSPAWQPSQTAMHRCNFTWSWEYPELRR